MNDGTAFEEDVRRLHQSLLEVLKPGVEVALRKKLPSRIGEIEVDVYFEIPGLYAPQSVVIECKDHKRPVELGQVMEFAGKLNALYRRSQGVMVSRNGFQAGAVRAAEHENVLLMDMDELIHYSLASRLRVIAFPTKEDVGEPFWTIMQFTGDGFDGHPLCRPRDDGSGIKDLILFLSKRDAQEYLVDVLNNRDGEWGVCGLRQRHLWTCLLFTRWFHGDVLIVERPSRSGDTIRAISLSVQQTSDDYLLNDRLKDLLNGAPQSPLGSH